MINYHKELVAALNTILSTHYELALTSGTKTPCISYQERNNVDAETGDTLGYSRISFIVKVWGTLETIVSLKGRTPKKKEKLSLKGRKRNCIRNDLISENS